MHCYNSGVANTKATNPFYVLLMAAGTAFALTACAYGVMAVKMLDPAQVAEEGDSSRFFVETMDQHGMPIMLVELAVIALSTVAAIASDGFWSRRAASARTAAAIPTAKTPAAKSPPRQQADTRPADAQQANAQQADDASATKLPTQ
ncbi:MAG: hypothetical protein RIC55_10170 [Pirellulaceae bacterium]